MRVGDWRKALLQDIATLAGCQIISEGFIMNFCRALQSGRNRLAVPGRWLGVLLCGLLIRDAEAQVVSHNAELAHGAHIAELVCATCHIVARNQEFAPLLSKPAPSFFDIANRPGVSAQSLEHFIRHTHWDTDELPMTMPNPMLTHDQTHAVARYILSLRSH
jgi:mono/diheme cytochrome c family protein